MAGSNRCSNGSRSRLRLEIERIFEPARGQSALTLHSLSSSLDVVSKLLTVEIGHLMASLSNATLKEIQWAGMTRRAYVSCFSDDGIWHGDRCGCSDDRCIDFHHDASEDCNCLGVCLEDAQLILARRTFPALDAHLTALETAHGVLWRELSELPRGSDSDREMRVLFTESADRLRLACGAGRVAWSNASVR